MAISSCRSSTPTSTSAAFCRSTSTTPPAVVTPPSPGRESAASQPASRATRLGLDIRYVVTNITSGTAEWLYADLYCARGQAENLIKLHKAQLASDRTSCRAATANQMRLVLHTAAYWLVLAVRDAIPKAHALAKAEFTTIRLRLLKVAARVTETASRVRIAFASACPDAVLFRPLAGSITPAGP